MPSLCNSINPSHQIIRGNDNTIVDELLELGKNHNEKQKRSRWNQAEEKGLIIKTKVGEIAYQIRKEQRDFDKAYLLEQLAEALLQKRTCVLAFKIRQQSENGGRLDCYDQINEIIKLTNSPSIIQLLLSLSNTDPSPSDYTLSEFAKRFMQNQMMKASSSNPVILPLKSDYVSSDTFMLERDKSLNQFYVQYDNTSFENLNLSSQLQDSNFNTFLTSTNRFNQALQGIDKQDSNGLDQNNQFMGAINRIQPTGLFGATNPFNITFELPPLPQIESLENNQELQDEFNFFSQMKTPSVKKDQDGGIAWVSQKKDNAPAANRRQMKQKHKKANKRALLWSLMPYVDESLLEHNIKNESGLKALWEDEHLDYKMRNLQVSENGLITKFKVKEFNSDFSYYSSDIIKVPGTRSFTEQEIVSSTILMLQGVPSLIFELEQESFTFHLRDNIKIVNHALNYQLLQSTFQEMLEAGSYFLHLKEFSEFMSNPINECGQILENFAISIADFLSFYQNQVNNIEPSIILRRSMENKLLFKEEKEDETSMNRQVTMFELKIHMSQLIQQIKLLASICFTNKFIQQQSNIEEWDEPSKQQQQRNNIYNALNYKNFQQNIDKIKQKQWSEEFPKGAQLLTYLYKIILCCESDLQSIDLLRRIFQKAIEPLLKIISMFIFTGDFKDPFHEFFIDKLYRKGTTGDVSNSQDFMFKFTSEPELKVPVFFMETASLIFKTGCSVHLLQRKNLKIIDYESLMQYYSICCGQSVNKFVTKLDKSDIYLNFEINQLRDEQESRQKFYDQQLQRLQEIELRIVQSEEELYYKQVVLREEAKQKYLLARQEEAEREQKLIQDKKDAFMNDIKIQMEEKRQQKEQERQNKLRENEDVKKEQEEYQRKKQAIEEELKRQYLEMMRENQKLGDMRKDEIKDEEELDNEVKKLIEEQEIFQHEQARERDIPDDVSMHIENPFEVQIEVQAMNEGVQETVNDGHQVNEDDQELEMDEIKLLESSPQDIVEQSHEEKVQFIKNIFLTPLLKNVFERIDEKKLMDNKRKTWIQKRKEERIQKAQERKTVWKYHKPEVSVKDKLDQVFNLFQQAHSKTSQSDLESHETNSDSNNVPTALALRQCVISVVKDQSKIVNQCLLHMMYRKLQLLKHLEVLKKFYFCNQGDVISLFMQSIFNDDFDSTVKENSVAFINGQFDLSIRLSFPYSSSDQQMDEQFTGVNSLSQSLSFELVNEKGIIRNPNFFFTAFNMGDYIWLNYKRQYPLDMAISHQCIQKYNTIFFFLLRLKRVNQVLGSLWKYLGSSEFKNLSIAEYSKIRRIQTLRSRMQHFVTMMEQYALTEVIESLWTTFKESMTHITVFEELIKFHNDFLDQVLVKCFIDKKDHKVMGQINQMFGFVLQLNKIVKEYGSNVCRSSEAIKEIIQIDQSFQKYTEFLYQLVKHLAYKGQFKELFLRLDFNKFYEKDSNKKEAFKNHKKFIEKELSVVIQKINQLKKLGLNGSDNINKEIDRLVAKLQKLKESYQKLIEGEDRLFEVLRKRLNHLDNVIENQGSTEVMKDYYLKRLHRIIADYLLRENYFQTSLQFIQDNDLKDLTDQDVFQETSKIYYKLCQQDCDEALFWCNTHKTKLQKTNFIKLIKKNDLLEANTYARKHLQKFDQSQEQLHIISKAFGLMICKREQREQLEQYKYFTDKQRWKELEDHFLKESFSLHALTQTPLIEQALQVGISVLKTEFCDNNATFNEQCPTCSPNIRKLGQKLLYSHQTHTCIQCALTGEIMNDQNPPHFLPNGYVVSEKGLQSLPVDHTNPNKRIFTPTSESFDVKDVRKVFFS